MSEMSASFTFEIPSLVRADYSKIDDVRKYAESIGIEFDDSDDLSEGPGWGYVGSLMSIVVEDDPEFDEIEEDEDGYKPFVWGVSNTLREAYDGVRDAFEGDPSDMIRHRINGSSEDFDRALASE